MVILNLYWLCILVSCRTFIECKRGIVEFQSKRKFSSSSTGLFQRNKDQHNYFSSPGEMGLRIAVRAGKTDLQQRTPNLKFSSPGEMGVRTTNLKLSSPGKMGVHTTNLKFSSPGKMGVRTTNLKLSFPGEMGVHTTNLKFRSPGEMGVRIAAHADKTDLQQRTTNLKSHSNLILPVNPLRDRLTQGQMLSNKRHNQVVARMPDMRSSFERKHGYSTKPTQSYSRNIMRTRTDSEYPHHSLGTHKEERTIPQNVTYSVLFGYEDDAVNKQKEPSKFVKKSAAKSSMNNPYGWNTNASQVPSYFSLLYKPGYNPFNMSSMNSSNRMPMMSSFYNDDYDPYNTSSNYPYNNKSPFNKTAYEEFRKGYREYMKEKYNITIPTPPNMNKTKEGNGKQDTGKDKTKQGEETSQRSLDNPDDTVSTTTAPFVMPSFYNDDYDPYNNSKNYPYNNKSPFNKTAFLEFGKQFQEYVKSKYNVSYPPTFLSDAKNANQTKQGKEKAITPNDVNDKGDKSEQRSLYTSGDKPSDKKSVNTSDKNPYNSSPYTSYNMPSFYNDDYDPYYNTSSDYPYYDWKSPFNKTAFNEFNKKFQDYVESKMNQQNKPSSPKNESKVSNVTDNSKNSKEKSAAQPEFTDKEEEEDIKAIAGDQTNVNYNNEEEPQQATDNEQMEEATAQDDPDIVDNTPVAAEISQIQDGLTGLTNDSSIRCHLPGQNCYSEKEMVVVLEVQKNKDKCIPANRRYHGNSKNNGFGSNNENNSADTPVVVIDDDPYRAFSKKTSQGISSMGSLKDLESLMASPTRVLSGNRHLHRTEDCKATCTC